MTQLPMYPAQVNSPGFTLAAPISASDTEITFEDLTNLLPAPNTLDIYVDDTDTTPETIRYTTSPAGSVLTVERGFQGTAKSFLKGAKAYREFTAYDHNTDIANIADAAAHATGTAWYQGTGIPDSGTGNDGDYYLRTSTDDLYLKTSGAWSVLVNIKGATRPGVVAGGAAGQLLAKKTTTDYDTEWVTPGSGSGDVVGPSSATDGAIALFDTTTGKKIKDSAKTIVTTLGAGDTTVPTSKAVKDVTDGKAAATHSHAESDVTGLVADLSTLASAISGKAPVSHSHAESDVTGLTTDLADKAPATSRDYEVCMAQQWTVYTPTSMGGTDAEFITEVLGTSGIERTYLGYTNGITQHAYLEIEMPDDWDGGNVDFRFNWETASASTNTCIMQLWGLRVADNGTSDAALSQLASVTDTNNGAGKRNISAYSSDFTISGTGNHLSLMLTRSTSDTLAAAVKILSVTLKYTRTVA